MQMPDGCLRARSASTSHSVTGGERFTPTTTGSPPQVMLLATLPVLRGWWWRRRHASRLVRLPGRVLQLRRQHSSTQYALLTQSSDVG